MLCILYVGSLRPGGNGLDRVALFEAAGFRVIMADRFAFMQAGTRLERSLAARAHIGRSVLGFDRMLHHRAAQGGFDIVFVDKGVWVRPATLRLLKDASTSHLAIHFTPDAQFLENRSRFFNAALPEYDLAITTKPFEVDNYKLGNAREMMLIHQGFGGRLIPVPEAQIPAELRSDVAFIGHCQPHYAHLLRQIAEQVPLAVWGPGWDEYAKRHDWASGIVRGTGIYGADYPRALSGAKIAIGLLSKRIPETTTTRSFEVPACGTMLLAERTEAHQALFEEGHEAEFFDTVEECVEKAAFYLHNDGARERIAAAGLRRSQTSGYSVTSQFTEVVNWIEGKLGKVSLQ